MTGCTAPGCSNRHDPRESGIKIKKFPTKPERFHAWHLAVLRNCPWVPMEWSPTKSTALCTAHFREEDFVVTLEGERTNNLKKDAVPTIFQWNKKKPPPANTQFQTESDFVTANCIYKYKGVENWRTFHAFEHGYTKPSTQGPPINPIHVSNVGLDEYNSDEYEYSEEEDKAYENHYEQDPDVPGSIVNDELESNGIEVKDDKDGITTDQLMYKEDPDIAENMVEFNNGDEDGAPPPPPSILVVERSEDIFTDDIGTSEISKPVTAIDIQNREYARQLEEEKEKMKKDRHYDGNFSEEELETEQDKKDEEILNENAQEFMEHFGTLEPERPSSPKTVPKGRIRARDISGLLADRKRPLTSENMLDSDPASKTPRFGDNGSFQPFPSGLGPVNEPNDICFEIDPAGQISMAGTSGAMLKNAKKPKKKRQPKQKQLPNMFLSNLPLPHDFMNQPVPFPPPPRLPQAQLGEFSGPNPANVPVTPVNLPVAPVNVPLAHTNVRVAPAEVEVGTTPHSFQHAWVLIRRQQMEVTRLKHKVNKTVSILNKEKREKKKLADQLKKFDLKGDIFQTARAMKQKSMGIPWARSTLKKATNLYETLGHRGYHAVTDMGLPVPTTRVLQKYRQTLFREAYMRRHNLKPEEISKKSMVAMAEKVEKEESQNYIGHGSAKKASDAWNEVKRDEEGKVIIPPMRRGPGERAQFMRERLAREKKGEKHSSSSEDDDDIYCQDENEDISDQEDDDGGSSSEEDGEEGDRTPRVSKNTVLVKKGIPRPQGPSNRSGSPVVIDLDDGPASKPEGEKVKGSGGGGTVVVNLDNGSGSKPEGVKTKASGGGMVVVNLGKPAEAKPKPAGTVVVNLGQENKTPQPPSARKGLVVNLGGETVDEVQASSISVASAPASSIMSDSVSVVDLEGDRPPVEEHRTVVAELLAPLAPTTPEVISVSVISTSQSSLSLDLGQLPPEDLFDQDTYG